ncbi:helix-hairpin-helix domain-containing protein [Acidaminococcus fermentans]|uniref:helix-hairpin-helix domain-containing protein n=1 Tax=Acidaminococcus fermentans TaxID=905 RepID=UPI0024331D44|nr:helix-hairpin-helix domain-containing protein [Acidaminococcus fermentans]
MDPWEKKKWLVVLALVLVCAGGSLWQAGEVRTERSETLSAVRPEKAPTEKKKRITIYISGAVQEPGLYQVPPGLRFQEALAEAGGVTAEADLTRVNLARKCKDGSQINVPFLKKNTRKTGNSSGRKDPPPASIGKKTGQGAAGKINLNQAGIEELTELPGIGPALARRIVEYRQAQPFQKIEDLQQVSGIGPAKFRKLRDQVEV